MINALAIITICATSKTDSRGVMMQYKVREIRTRRGLTQEELSALSGVSRGIIHRIESEKNYETTVGTLEAIANALNVSVRYLFKE